jgi:hypothetical protein
LTIERMPAVPFITVPKDEHLSWQQICERYPKQWVVLVHIDWPNCRTVEFRSAVVVGYAATRDAALDAARARVDELRDEFACFCTERNILWMRPNGDQVATSDRAASPLSWAEICSRFPDEWVYLADVEEDDKRRIVSGRVLDHDESISDIMERNEALSGTTLIQTAGRPLLTPRLLLEPSEEVPGLAPGATFSVGKRRR